MKILIMNWRDAANPSAGGAELVTHEMAKRWIEWGNEVRLLTSRYPRAKSEENVDGLDVTRVGGKYSVYPATAYRFLSEYSNSFDVVVDQINSIPFLTPLYCRVPIVPLVFQVTGEIYHREMPRFVSSVAVFVERLLLRLYQNRPTMVLSNSTKLDLVSRGFSPDCIHVCPPGVNHEKFSCGKKTSYPSIVYLNRFARYKNPDHVLVSFREVLDEIPACKLTMAGVRTNDDLHHFQKLIEDLRIGDSARIIPFLGGERKLELLQSSWVHVLPSMREGWGISILEAAACGTPTVGYDVAGVRDAVRHMKTGLLVRYGSTNSLAKALVTVLANTELRESLGAEGLSWSREFTWEGSAIEGLKALSEAVHTGPNLTDT